MLCFDRCGRNDIDGPGSCCRIDRGAIVYYLKNNGILTRCTDLYRDERFRSLGLNSRQSVLLLQVCKNPGITQDALSKAIMIDKSNITRQMIVLEEAGLVERLPAEEDRRQIKVFPTDRALTMLPEIRKGFREWREYLKEGLTDEELSAFCATMEKITRRAAEYCGRIVTEEEA